MPENETYKAKIIQFSDDQKTLPDGSKVIYAENDVKIVVYHKIPFEKGTSYAYDRKTGKIIVNGKEGNNDDKRKMLTLGSYFLDNTDEDDLVTIAVQSKES
ncbi:MAG: hypothetical protein CL521_05495 [Actinobacteria bacterium]|nr:hypothetical protein [Actinomycetota bacterium]|tara:strand:- start:83 stop:385 length:303 start_codon:yes stop_codon:yes gene_type:complete